MPWHRKVLVRGKRQMSTESSPGVEDNAQVRKLLALLPAFVMEKLYHRTGSATFEHKGARLKIIAA